MTEIVKPEPIPMPAVGDSYQDPAFKTTVKRISDAAAHGVAWVTPEYSTICPWNADNSRLLLCHQDHFALYDGEGLFLYDLDVPANAEPRWSRTDPDLFYFCAGNILMSYRFSDVDFTTTERVFEEYDRITGKGESDISADGDHMVFIGDEREVFVYQISTQTKGPALNVSGYRVESLYLTPKNEALISWA